MKKSSADVTVQRPATNRLPVNFRSLLCGVRRLQPRRLNTPGDMPKAPIVTVRRRGPTERTRKRLNGTDRVEDAHKDVCALPNGCELR